MSCSVLQKRVLKREAMRVFVFDGTENSFEVTSSLDREAIEGYLEDRKQLRDRAIWENKMELVHDELVSKFQIKNSQKKRKAPVTYRRPLSRKLSEGRSDLSNAGMGCSSCISTPVSWFVSCFRWCRQRL